MSDGPALELQGAVRVALGAWAPLDALVGDRIYDRVPNFTVWPGDYIHLGEHQEIDDGAPIQGGIYEGAEHYLTLHAFSRSVGSVQAKKIAQEIKKALNNVDLTLADHHLVNLSHDNTNIFTDQDGLTTHAVIVFNALTEPKE